MYYMQWLVICSGWLYAVVGTPGLRSASVGFESHERHWWHQEGPATVSVGEIYSC